MEWVVDGLSEDKYKVPHPSLHEKEWDEYWNKGKLKDKYNLF
jgi:hypothetical protein